MDKLIITCCPVGAETTRADNPNLPLSPSEIARASLDAVAAGASIVHLHVRDEKGNPSQDPKIFEEVIRLIRKDADPIVQISTGGAVTATAEERLRPVLELAQLPEMASLTTGTVNFGNDVFYNPPALIETFAKTFKEKGIKPEIEVFEAGMINNALRLVKKGHLLTPLHFDFVLGVPGAMTGNAANLIFLLGLIPEGSTWTVAGVGAAELALGAIAITLGGHVRVGFEDNIFYRKGELATSNAQLVSRIARLAGELNREVADPQEARRILKIKGQ
ncbi:MAG TPA: 3-keto-5-aminohexanoate cleavage protein [Chroococcales cyanobacterium]|jgi:3-keto-5-aminohexanoate cleavage enzyme